MIARHREKPHSQVAHQLRGMVQIRLNVGAVHGNVPRMDDEVGVLLGDPMGERRPVVGEMRLARAQMGVRDLD